MPEADTYMTIREARRLLERRRDVIGGANTRAPGADGEPGRQHACDHHCQRGGRAAGPPASLTGASGRGRSIARPLDGVPMSLKDVLITEGVRTTCGSRHLDDFVPPFDGTVPGKLAAAGAVLLGKTNCDEFAMGSSTENSAWGPTRNPWDLTACRAAQRRLGGGGGGGLGAFRSARTQAAASPARLAVRGDRPEANLWAGVALRTGGFCLVARPDRAVHARCL